MKKNENRIGSKVNRGIFEKSTFASAVKKALEVSISKM